eukprot:TRINITY_DN26968_c0_g2_i1.p1 TRINITY_DN26968_c0_g2~~TRINITY_DN26968_c0_g2_i1.p1  ORF type:complete len:582 (+),score=156.74 TRINITY_DN26968_c0_g2_i1:140-1885(+)
MAGTALEDPGLQFSNGLPDQLQQMSTMMAMAAAGMAGSPYASDAGSAGLLAAATAQTAAAPLGAALAAPSMLPGADASLTQAYAQMLVAQYLQQSQAQNTYASAATMAAQAAPVPPLAPAAIRVSVEGMNFAYQLMEDDLQKVFRRYGTVRGIKVDSTASSAIVYFESLAQASAAMTDLNGKVLNGLDGTLRITWDQVAPAMSPALVPPAAQPTALPLPATLTALSAMASSLATPFPVSTPAQNLVMPGWEAAAAAMWPLFADTGAAATATAPLPPPTAPAALPVPVPVLGAAQGGAPVGAALAVEKATTASEKVPTSTSRSKEADEPKAHVKGVKKYTCRFIIGIENDKDFQVVRQIIGPKGANMKRIVNQTDAKLRLRGIGSGYFEGPGQRESPEPLQLCVSCTSSEGYRVAAHLVEELLEQVYRSYRRHCIDRGLNVPDLRVTSHFTPSANAGRSGEGSTDDPVDDSTADALGDDDSGNDGRAGEAGTTKESGGRRRGRRSKKRGGGSGDRVDPPPQAPSVDEIEKQIALRNDARRQCNFVEADRIRKALSDKGVALMDEPGGRGKGNEVTTWRYWRE